MAAISTPISMQATIQALWSRVIGTGVSSVKSCGRAGELQPSAKPEENNSSVAVF